MFLYQDDDGTNKRYYSYLYRTSAVFVMYNRPRIASSATGKSIIKMTMIKSQIIKLMELVDPDDNT